MTLDPQMRNFVEQLAAAGTPPDFGAIGAQAARAFADARGMPGKGPDIHRVSDVDIPGRNGPMAGRLYVPRPDPRCLLVYLHGGGWTLGSIAGYDPPLRHFADRSGCALLSFEYRLAPEHRFPTAVEDCIDCVRWAAANLVQLDLDAGLPVAVGGDSAGGNLSAVVALLARDEGSPDLAAQLLIYPATQADFTTPSYRTHVADLPLTARSMQWFWDQYIPDLGQRRNPLASPLHAPDLSGLPRALVVLAGYDPLLSEGEAYAERLQQADNTVTVLRYDGLTHGFFQFSELLPVAGRALEEIADRFCELLPPS